MEWSDNAMGESLSVTRLNDPAVPPVFRFQCCGILESLGHPWYSPVTNCTISTRPHKILRCTDSYITWRSREAGIKVSLVNVLSAGEVISLDG
jgi:hypothetical protein